MAFFKKTIALVVLAAMITACGSHYCPTYGKASVTKPVKRNFAKH